MAPATNVLTESSLPEPKHSRRFSRPGGGTERRHALRDMDKRGVLLRATLRTATVPEEETRKTKVSDAGFAGCDGRIDCHPLECRGMRS